MEIEMFTKPEIMDQIYARLSEVGFTMDDWVVNVNNACPENHMCKVNGVYYDSYDYIYVVNKANKIDMFNLWLDIAWTDGIEIPVVFILYLYPEIVEAPLESLDGYLENQFKRKDLAESDYEKLTEEMRKKYSIKPIPHCKNIIKKLVTSDQYNAIMDQPYFKDKRNLNGQWSEL